MTNTRITDPEILELRYRVRVEEFSIRQGSEGAGARGEQHIQRAGGTLEHLPGRAQAQLNAGDAFVIKTPGGGGYNLP